MLKLSPHGIKSNQYFPSCLDLNYFSQNYFDLKALGLNHLVQRSLDLNPIFLTRYYQKLDLAELADLVLASAVLVIFQLNPY